MTISELSKKYGVPRSTMHHAIIKRHLKVCERDGRCYQIEEKDFLEWKKRWDLAKRTKSAQKVKTKDTAKMRVNNKQCKDCIYKCMLDGAVACDYLAKTGERRGCPTYPSCEKRKTKQ